MNVKYEYYASDTSSTTVGTEGWEQAPYTGGRVDLWAPSFDLTYPHWGDPVIIREPKKSKWKPMIVPPEKLKRIDDIDTVTVHIEVRPVMICGWCGARIQRGKETKECDYCGS